MQHIEAMQNTSECEGHDCSFVRPRMVVYCQQWQMVVQANGFEILGSRLLDYFLITLDKLLNFM